MKKGLPGKINIIRPMNSHDDRIRIELIDENSHIHFLELKMTLADFTKAVTGQGYIPIEFDVRGLENVGLVKEMMPLEFPLPPETNYSNEKEVAKELAHKHCNQGYQPSLYFGSQTSFKRSNGVTVARTTQYRYVEPEESTNE